MVHDVKIGVKRNRASKRDRCRLTNCLDKFVTGIAALAHPGLALACGRNSNRAHVVNVLVASKGIQGASGLRAPRWQVEERSSIVTNEGRLVFGGKHGDQSI